MNILDAYGFNPNMIQTPTMQPRAMVPNPPQINTVGVLQPRELEKVNGIESAKQYPMQPNSRVALFDMNEDIFYVKQTDASNFPTIRKFRFYEELEQPAQAPQVDSPQYVTMDEFNALKEEINNGQQSIWEAINAAAKSDSKTTVSRAKRNDADV